MDLLAGPRPRPGEHPLRGEERGGGARRHHQVQLLHHHRCVEHHHRHQQRHRAHPPVGERAASGERHPEPDEEQPRRPERHLARDGHRREGRRRREVPEHELEPRGVHPGPPRRARHGRARGGWPASGRLRRRASPAGRRCSPGPPRHRGRAAARPGPRAPRRRRRATRRRAGRRGAARRAAAAGHRAPPGAGSRAGRSSASGCAGRPRPSRSSRSWARSPPPSRPRIDRCSSPSPVVGASGSGGAGTRPGSTRSSPGSFEVTALDEEAEGEGGRDADGAQRERTPPRRGGHRAHHAPPRRAGARPAGPRPSPAPGPPRDTARAKEWPRARRSPQPRWKGVRARGDAGSSLADLHPAHAPLGEDAGDDDQ